MKLYRPIYLFFFLLSIFFSCKKGYLDIKPDQSLLVPTTLFDMQRILDNDPVMNLSTGLTALSTDEYDLSTATLSNFNTPGERNAYVWADDIFERQKSSDWEVPYKQVFYANVVIDGLKKIEITAENKLQWESIKGSALFYRAFAFYQLADEFSSPYEPATANQSAGIPIKLSSDVNERPGRGTVQMVYEQIFKDLNNALQILPEKPAPYFFRPSRLACYALMARISLANADYRNALKYSDECIKISPVLLDYNTLSPSSIRPIPLGGAEMIFYHNTIDYSFGSSVALNLSRSLTSLYKNNDLRKVIFMRDRGNGIITFKGNYSGNRLIFTGLATDEMYLIRAECKARTNDIDGAMDDLNRLLITRWDNKTVYPVIKADNANDAIQIIINERRKELVSRGLRWADLKRLNQEAKFAVTLKRTINGKEYILKPNDKKYVFPIPQNEIDGSGIEQNKR
ncbi:tetratricopeptide (TPR) repeat protein [Pedobacter sp. UYP30]|uniref:RagB/SusD family nutrient uptake outer membrane protein n=1 Tax=Pedobacter sp. UYP30 TaxID=1756400 RepID=UPI0033957F70